MKKYHLKRLSIELTRRCNYNCIHCYHGDAQDVTITPEIIDTMFSQLSRLDHIALLGGESLLELDMLEYLLEAVDRYRLNTELLSFVTNGSIIDPRVLQIFNQFIDKKSDRSIYMRISNDQFHDNEQSEKAFSFYSSANNDTRIEIEAPNERFTKLLDVGRVEEWSFEDAETHGIKFYSDEAMVRNHQICIRGNQVGCIIQLSANGNVGFDRSLDYETVDTAAFGNILDDSLENLFTKHNRTCYVLCDEAYNSLIMNETYKYKENLNVAEEDQRLYSLLCDRRLRIIWLFRAMWQDTHPDLDMREIISIFPPLSIQNWEAVCGLILGEDIGVERAKAAYKAEFKEKHPDATNEEVEHLSFMKYTLDLLDRTSMVTFFRMLKKLRCIGVFSYLSSDFDVCGKIPDSVENLRKDKKD